MLLRLACAPRTPHGWHSDRGRSWPDVLSARLPAVPADTPAVELDVRRGDIDVNGHVNHAYDVSRTLEAASAADGPRGAPVHLA